MLKKVSLCKWTRITIMTVAFIVLISCQKAPDQTDSTVSILLMSSESLLSSEIDSNTGEDESSQKDEVSSQFVSSRPLLCRLHPRLLRKIYRSVRKNNRAARRSVHRGRSLQMMSERPLQPIMGLRQPFWLFEKRATPSMK